MGLIIPKGIRAKLFIGCVAERTSIDMKKAFADPKAIDAGK